LPENDTCSLDSLTRVRKDLQEHHDRELMMYQEKGVKGIQRMSAGAYDLYASRILMTRGLSKFISLTKNRDTISGLSTWKIVACSPPKDPHDGNPPCATMDIHDKDKLATLKEFPLIVIFGHEETGIRKTVLSLADVHLSIPKFDRLPATTAGVDSLNLSVSVGIVLSHLFTKK
jgi:hypothetical protein